MDELQKATQNFVDTVLEYYKENDNDDDLRDLSQVHCRGYFAGMSEREIKALAEHLHTNNKLYPLYPVRETCIHTVPYNEPCEACSSLD